MSKNKKHNVKDFSNSDFNHLKNKREITSMANDLADSKGFANAKTFIDETRTAINSPNQVKSGQAKKAAKQFTADLLLLVLYQTIEDMTAIKYINYFSNMFDDGQLSDGNTWQYIQPLDTGADAFKAGAFIPEGVTEQDIESTTINMYKTDKTLHEQAYQFKKPLTIQEALWYPYFITGKLSEYIAQIQAMCARTYTFYKFDKLATFLTTTITPQKIINGTAPNIFKCFADEIIPEIENMTLLNSDYNISATSKLVSTVDKENLLIILPATLQSKLRVGVLSQLYNAKYLNLDDNYLSENILTLGDKINVPASSALVNVDKTKPYLPNTRIIVIDKRAIRHLFQVNKSEQQTWAENMSIQFTLHVWGLYGVLPWFKMFIYNNPNLLVLPTAANDSTPPTTKIKDDII